MICHSYAKVLLTIIQGLYAGYEYVIYQWSIYPGIRVHQWNLPLRDLEGFLYVSGLLEAKSARI